MIIKYFNVYGTLNITYLYSIIINNIEQKQTIVHIVHTNSILKKNKKILGDLDLPVSSSFTSNSN